MHDVPLGSEVVLSDLYFLEEFKGEKTASLTLRVIGYTRDCDGTPLYVLGNGSIKYINCESLSSEIAKNAECYHSSSIFIRNLSKDSFALTGKYYKIFDSYKEMFRS